LRSWNFHHFNLMEAWRIIFTLGLGAVTSFYGTSVGGAGLLVIPVLILLGLTPQSAVATANFGFVSMAGVGFITFHRAKGINYRIGIPAAFITVVGALIGSFILLELPELLLERLIGFSILLILLFLVLQKSIGTIKRDTNVWLKCVGYGLFLPLGIYGAVISGGMAILFTYILIFFFGETFLESAGTRKPGAFAKMIIVAVVVGLHGVIQWEYGLLLLVGNSVGAYVGSRFALQKGSTWIRALFIVVTIVSVVKLLM